MKKTFPLEDVLTFTSGITFGSVKVHPLDTSCYLYQIANVVTGKINNPFDLLDDAPRIILMIKSQFPEITDWNIGQPVGGWDSISGDVMGEELAEVNRKAFIASLCQKFNRTTFDLEGPDNVEEPTHGIKVVEL